MCRQNNRKWILKINIQNHIEMITQLHPWSFPGCRVWLNYNPSGCELIAIQFPRNFPADNFIWKVAGFIGWNSRRFVTTFTRPLLSTTGVWVIGRWLSDLGESLEVFPLVRLDINILYDEYIVWHIYYTSRWANVEFSRISQVIYVDSYVWSLCFHQSIVNLEKLFVKFHPKRLSVFLTRHAKTNC